MTVLRRPVTHQARPVLDELREMRDIARREHGSGSRATRFIEQRIEEERARARGSGRARNNER